MYMGSSKHNLLWGEIHPYIERRGPETKQRKQLLQLPHTRFYISSGDSHGERLHQQSIIRQEGIRTDGRGPQTRGLDSPCFYTGWQQLWKHKQEPSGKTSKYSRRGAGILGFLWVSWQNQVLNWGSHSGESQQGNRTNRNT